MVTTISLVNIHHHTKLLQYCLLYFLCCTLHPHDFFVSGSLYLLILSFRFLNISQIVVYCFCSLISMPGSSWGQYLFFFLILLAVGYIFLLFSMSNNFYYIVDIVNDAFQRFWTLYVPLKNIDFCSSR